ncbi:MAG: hypothetical protein WKF35_11990 [Ferruginibacter sp.]
MNKNGLLLAGIAAFAYYKYKKMTPEAKKKMVDGIKDKVNEHVPSNIRGLFDSLRKAPSAPEYGKGTF